MRKAAGIIAAAALLAACQTEENTMEENAENADVINDPENTEDNEDNNVENESEEEIDPVYNNDENNNEEAEQMGTSLTEVSPEDWNVETVAENLPSPWEVKFSDEDDTIYMTSRDGYMLELLDGDAEQVDVITSDGIVQEGEGGLLGFELYEEGDAFLYYTYESDENGLANRIVRAERTEEGWEENEILVDDIEGASTHNGGRIALGPDDMLYATAGDAEEPDWSQDEKRLAGSILRLTADGEVPDDNPFDDSFVYSYGHRNPQGIAWNSDDEMYSSEHGAQALDEVNIIEPGNNYGWPVIEGDEDEEGMETPAIHSGDDTWAPSGAAFWEDEFITVGLRGQSVYVFDEEAEEMHVTYEGEGRLRDVVYQDEALYILTNNTDGRGDPADNDDRLLRLTLD